MKLPFTRNEFCYPTDFFWINKESVKKNWEIRKAESVVALIIYFALATLAFVGYYLFLPFRILHEWCEEWCYR